MPIYRNLRGSGLRRSRTGSGLRRGLLGGFSYAEQILATSPALFLDAGLSLKWQESTRTTPAVTDADLIGAWDDLSGNGRNVLQATNGLRPLLKLAIQNGKPIVRFDGLDDYLQSALFGAAFAQPNTTIVVTSLDATGVALGGGAGADNGIYAETGLVKCYAGTALASAVGTPVGVSLMTFIVNGASSSLFRNGTSIATGDAGAQSLSRATLGIDPGLTAGYYLAGDVCTALIYNRALNAGERQNLEALINGRWAIY